MGGELFTLHQSFYRRTGPRVPTTILHFMLTEDMVTVHFSGLLLASVCGPSASYLMSGIFLQNLRTIEYPNRCL